MTRPVVAGVLVVLLLGSCTSSQPSGPAETVPTSAAVTVATTLTATGSSSTTRPADQPSTTAPTTPPSAPSELDQDVGLIVDLYEGWSQAASEGPDVIEAYLASHLYPDLQECASGEKQLTPLTAESDTIHRVDEWSITWGPLNGTVADGRVYEVQLRELDSPSHVTIIDDVAYVFWNCTGTAVEEAEQFAFVESVDPSARTIVVDYATWYTGDERFAACERDGNEPCHAEPGYYISNTNPRLRTLRVAPDVVIAHYAWLNEPPAGCIIATPSMMDAAGLDLERTIEGCIVSLDAFADYVAAGGTAVGETEEDWFPVLAWLVIKDGVVTALQEQYVP